jgi:hypothetical protein
MNRNVLVLTYDDIRNANRNGLDTVPDPEWISRFAYYFAGTQLPPGTVKAIILYPDDPDRSRMSYSVNDHGFRILKERRGKLPPPDEFPRVFKRMTFRNGNNPEGLEKVVVRRKILLHGEWHPVVGWAYWDELVPLTRWRTEPDGSLTEIEPYLDRARFPQWSEKPISTLTKCAEMDAMRRAWPGVFEELHIPEELDWVWGQFEAEHAVAA